jgi:SAM-dependent methyltransferase
MEGYGPDTYGDAFADVYDAWYADLGDAEAVVDAVAAVAGRVDGAILELGVGTGRLAIPLAQRGFEVVGLDASAAMVNQLASKPGGEDIETHLADMSDAGTIPHAARFGVVFAAFNTLLNLPTADDRRRCFDGLVEVMVPDGRLAIEAVVPGPDPDGLEDHVEIRTMATDRLVLTVSRRDPAAQTVSGHHVELTDGAPVRLRPWQLGYLSPEQLDAEANRSGLALEHRTATWDGAPFDDTSVSHVSWYRLADT